MIKLTSLENRTPVLIKASTINYVTRLPAFTKHDGGMVPDRTVIHSQGGFVAVVVESVDTVQELMQAATAGEQ